MTHAVVLIWLGTAASREIHEPDLASWARSRMVALDEPAGDHTLTTADHDDALSTRIESLLAEARTVSFADPPAAEAALQNAELLLRGNPALPEAAWLMAETCRDHATLVREQDPDLAAILERRAVVLDGGRAASFERAEGPAAKKASKAPPEERASPPRAPAAASGTAPSSLDGPLPGDEVDVDGVPMKPPRALGPGEHHVRVLRGGALAWAGWVTADGTSVSVGTPALVPCSETDLAQLRFDADHASGSVLCATFAVARDAGPSRVEVARCEQSRCGTFLPWSRAWGNELEGPMHPPYGGVKSNGWIPWAVVGVAAAAIGTFALVEAGAFDRKGEATDRLVVSGPGAKP